MNPAWVASISGWKQPDLGLINLAMERVIYFDAVLKSGKWAANVSVYP
jgi:hypothetical protein